MLVIAGMFILGVVAVQPLAVYEFKEYLPVLFPEGIIGVEQRNLLLIVQGIMLLVIIPVYILTFIFSWRYRSTNSKAVYDPDLIDNKFAEVLWWGIPLIFTIIIAVLTWIKTFELDPFKPIASDKKPLTIQVVALQWKWLFIYPEENIAVVNFLQFPKDIPLHFEITADAPMNSFWIPHLGGQIYAMPKMKSELNLIANSVGDFRGSSANISGEGFSGMHFIARSSSEEEYQDFVKSAKQSANRLSIDTYKTLAAPSSDDPVAMYQLEDHDLFNQILMKYMHPQTE